MFLFGDRGLPSSVRHVNAYSGNTYNFTKADGSHHYVRIHLLTNQGIHYYTNSEAAQIAGVRPDKHLLDLQEAIKSGNFPSWDIYVQVILPSEIANAPINIFDMTKVWPHKTYPLRKIGRMVLDRNPENWFTEIEQAAFSPSNMVNGIEPSPDPMLQARMFAYPDAARYRLGINYQFLPTNVAKSEVCCPTERDGFLNFTKNYGGDPNYVGSRIKPLKFHNHHKDSKNSNTDDDENQTSFPVRTKSTDDEISPVNTLDHAYMTLPSAFASTVSSADFDQPKALWKVMSKQAGAQSRFIDNLSAHLADVEEKWIREGAYGLLPQRNDTF